MSWYGQVMRDNKGKIGKVVGDTNGGSRILTILFEDGDKYDLFLNNLGMDCMDNRGIMWQIDVGDLKGKWTYLSDQHIHPDGSECRGAGKQCEDKGFTEG